MSSRAKWKLTSVATRGVLLTLWTLACTRDEEDHWRDRATLESDLGADLRVEPEQVTKWVDRLIELHWIDCDATTSPSIRLHDWRQWQPPMPKTGATRTQEWRDRKRGVTTGDADALHASHVTLGEERRGEDIEPSLRSGQKRDRLDQTVRAWITAQGMTAPNGYVLNDLKALVKGYGPEAVIVAMEAAKGRTAKERVKAAERTLAPTVTGSTSKGATRPIEEIEHAFEH
jgi:hypothetical protein